MFSTFITHLPPRVFWLANILFWLILNTLAADNAHRMRLVLDRPSIWIDTWFEFLPFWGNWAIVTPFIIAAVRCISSLKLSVSKQVGAQLLSAFFMMMLYWGLTVFEVTLVGHADTYGMSQLEFSLTKLLLSPMHLDFLVYMSIAGIGLAQSYYDKSREYAVKSERLANQLLQAELNALKAQLNPHFLFNTLNTISGLVRLDHKPSAVQALSELSHMFRSVLENQQQQLTTLRNEMEFIDSYLAIQKLRFENKIAMQLDISPQCLEMKLPFMLLHTLVENAVQHGSQLESDENLMRLNVTCTKGHLHIHLVNKAAKHDEHKGFGIGLKNCQKRLNHIYGINYSLSSKQIEHDYFETKLSIPAGIHYVQSTDS